MTTRIALLACWVAMVVPTAASAGAIGPVAHIVVTQSGLGPEHEGCPAFSVTPDEVRAFLERAVMVSGRQQHDFFLYGPCWARGTVESRYDTWQWEIRNLGTGRLTATNGDTFLIADPAQESWLDDDARGR